MDVYKQFLKQVSGKKDAVDQQLSEAIVEQVDKKLLSIIDAIKTIGKMSVPLRGERS